MQYVPEDPLWKKPGYYVWLLAITACIYNFVSNKWSLYFHDARGGPLNIGVLFIGLLFYYMVIKIGYSALMTLLSGNAIATTAINVGYLSLSILLPAYFAFSEINSANVIYKQAVADAKNQTTDTSASVPSPVVYETVMGASVSILAIALFTNYWAIGSNAAALFSAKDTVFSSVREILKTFPLLQYFKYVADNDYIDVAKRGSIMALLAYVVYLMYSVYASKNVLVACPDTSISTCFSFPFSSASASSSAKEVSYVNTLVWTLIFCSILNVVNWLIKTYGTRLFSSSSSNSNPAVNPQTDIGMLIRLVIFPVYWIFAMFAQNPVGAVIVFILIAAIGLLMYRSSFDLTSFVEGQRGTVITVFTLFIASLVAFGMYSMNSSTVEMKEGDPSYGQFIAKTGMTIGVAACVVGLILYFLNSHSRLVSMANVAQYGITALTYIVGIAIVIGVVRTLFSTSRKMGGSIFQVSADSNWVINVLKLMANMLFFLPCLMLDFVDTAKEQFGLTTHTAIILLAVELAFILAGHVLPSAVANAINHTGVQIVSAPISMTNNTKVSTYEIKFVDAHSMVESMPTPTTDGTSEPIQVLLQNYNYGVSAWFYIHPQPPSTNPEYSADASLNVLNFGSFGPNIAYSPKSNALQIKMDGGKASSDSATIPPITDIPLQTWNNVVVNSDKGTIDIFVNNKLVYTGNHVTVPDTTAKYASIGGGGSESNNDGIQGEICNVVLNRAPFTKNEIAWLYKTNKVLNPPVVGVSNQDPLNQGESASYLASESVNINAPTPTPMPKYSSSGMMTYGIVGAVLGALFGWLFNNDSGMSAAKGFIMGAIVFGLIGATLGTLFSTDGTVAYVLKTVANVFVDTF
jgi:hypothetical protein